MGIEMADLPGTVGRLTEEVRRTPRLNEVARAAGAVGECFCGSPIIDLYVLSSAVRVHYDLDDAQEMTFSQRVTDAEVDFSVGGMCPFHADAIAKDD